VDVLEEAFEVNCYPSTLMKKILAAGLNMENIQVQVGYCHTEELHAEV
jgi:hypothetical protein